MTDHEWVDDTDVDGDKVRLLLQLDALCFFLKKKHFFWFPVGHHKTRIRCSIRQCLCQHTRM